MPFEDPVRVPLSGERFTAVYRLAGPRDDALARARAIGVEQTVEFPADLLPAGDIPDAIVGRVEALHPAEGGCFDARLSYAVETAGGELTQLLNVLFGNASILPGVRLVDFDLPDSMLARFRGPRFGREGLRRLTGAVDRPLLCTAVKPMGLGPEALADLAYRFALGGIDLIKDDHGLADQPFCPFEARVQACAAAVARANEETGGRSLYLPNVTAAADRIGARVRFAGDAGARGLLLAPGLVGPDVVRRIADDDEVGLPILSHPALQGSFVLSSEFGIAHGALQGKIARLHGADACIFPSFGGRFSFSRDDCRSLARATAAPMGGLAPIFPVPAGGMTLERVPDLVDFYGPDAILLIGGDLHRRGPDLVATCRRFRELVEPSEAAKRTE